MSASAAQRRRRSLPGLALRAHPPLPPQPAPLLRAFDAFASDGLEKDLEIFRSVVVGDLVARLDVPDRAQNHGALDHVGFGVGTTGVVGIAGDIAAARAVHGPAAVDLVHVAVAARLELGGLRMGEEATAVGDDERALLDRRGGEQPQPGPRTADAIWLARRAARRTACHDRLLPRAGRNQLLVCA